jgi:molecular chaperone HtpG
MRGKWSGILAVRTMAEHKFQIDLRGIIDLLSNHLYSGPQVFVRELLQNGVDAISARRELDRDHAGEISIEVLERRGDTAPGVMFEDNGIGLTEEEVHRFLATIGESSKRGEIEATRDFIGQFGIGVLSGFVVSDEITMVTRSAKPGAKTIEWKGRPDGTYAVEVMDVDLTPGTRVYLRCKRGYEAYFTAQRIHDLARHYGGLLPWPIRLVHREDTHTINDEQPPWRREHRTARQEREAYLEFGRRVFEQDFFDYVPLHSEVGEVEGAAFVLPFAASPSIRRSHRIYLKNMLLSENAEHLLPEWAFFVKAVVNADDLRPTASREAFYEDATLEATRDALGEQLRGYLVQLSREDPVRLEQLIALHHTSIKALATHDDEFFSIMIDMLPFETTIGRMSFGEYRARQPLIRYVPTVDQFRRIAHVANAQGLCVINGGYAYDSELIERFGQFYDDAKIERVDSRELSEEFRELSLNERQHVFELVRLADLVLQPYKCQTDVKHFEPKSLPALYTTSAATDFRRDIERTRDVSNPLWSSVLENLAAARPGSEFALLCFNYDNPIVTRLARLGSDELKKTAIEMLYVHALLLGHHPLSGKEMKLLNSSLLGLLDLTILAGDDAE